MKITVVGTGYVGLVSGACLAEMGNDVLCLDLDPEKIRILNDGGIPIHEPGLDQIVSRNVAAGRLHFTTNVEEAVQFGTIQFIAVGTPPDEDGSADLKYVLSVGDAVARHRVAPVILVAVARNEKTMLPHFLAHYRGLGVRHFVLVDNLSDDGTREYLLAQPDVVLYSADTDYRDSHYGVAWQQAVLGAHALGRWVVLADIDEMLVYEDCERQPITQWLDGLQAQGHDAALTLMVDMYPAGDLAEADAARAENLFEMAPYFDQEPLLRWQLGAGHYSNAVTYLSALRHRLISDSAPNLYTSQKVAVFRYAPWVRLAQGLHYVSNLTVAPQPAFFAHFKYHAGFRQKVLQEIARKQHFNGAEEYRKYLALLAESEGQFNREGASARYVDSRTFRVLGDALLGLSHP